MSDQEISPSPDADPELAPEGAEANQGPDAARVPATHSSDDVMGTGEGPPPGTRVEAWLITAIGLAIVLLPVIGVLRRMADSLIEAQRLRWLAHALGTGLLFVLPKDASWTSIYVQIGTLWIGFLGAVLAAAGGKHLSLATTNFMARGRLRLAFETFSQLVFVGVALLLTYASARMVSANRGTGGADLLPGGLHSWMVELVIPISFAVMTVRVVARALHPATAFAGPHGSLPPELANAPLPRAVRLRRLILCGLVAALAALAFYIGMRYDGSDRIQAVLGRLDTNGIRRLVRINVVLSMTVGFLLGTPVFIVMAGLAMGLFFVGGSPIAALPTETNRLAANPSLPAIPLLTLAGYILASGRSSQRLVRAYKSVFGWMPGGMAVMVVFVCALFTTFTGASGVTILALGGLVYPMMVRDKYPKGFSLGLVTAAGSLGLLFPPSLPVLLYSVAASTPGPLPR